MTARTKNTAGFTLSELLLSVAIILVLAAIAIPSIITAQNNMRMVELNNAAESLANAAQTQMTAKKVSGAWLALIEKGGTGSDAHAVKYLQAVNPPTSDPSDTYYMTADEARKNGIVPSLSIDEQVRDGDFIIEFTASTANVVSVFYTDGKKGFFGSAPEDDAAAAHTYYTNGGARDQASRMNASPMIGYYQGTPAGATNAVALQNPVIWVSDQTSIQGLLCVQDRNLTDHPEWKTATSLALSKKDANGNDITFTIGGLSDTSGIVTVTIGEDDDAISCSYSSGAASKPIVQRVDRNGNASGDVYAIDLNALARAVNADAQVGAAAIAERINAFVAGDAVHVEAFVESLEYDCVPATAQANIEWPAVSAKLAIYVTNPSSREVGAQADYIGGTYVDPAVESVDREGKTAVRPLAISESASETIPDSNMNTALVAENPQAGTQFYTGGWVNMGEAVSAQASLKATAGSYTSGTSTHQYQVWELWVKQRSGDYTRVGYLRNNVWEWFDNYARLESCLTWHKADGTQLQGDIAGQNTEGFTTITVNTSELRALVQEGSVDLADDTGSVELFVRTAPQLSEVQQYFDGLVSSGAIIDSYLKDNALESASRRTQSSASSAARSAFESEFGASSSDVSWVVSREGKTRDSFEQANAYLAEGTNIRVYYSIAPGIGFENIKGWNPQLSAVLSGVRSTQMTNVALWLYRGDSVGSLQPQVPAMLISDSSNPYTCRYSTNVGAGNVYDFKLTNQEDERFYRVLTYEGVQSGTVASQYVPHIQASNPDVATIAAAANYDDDDYLYTFSHWTTLDTTSGNALEVLAGKTVDDYSTLAIQGTTLTAVYEQREKVDPSVGMMYIETGTDAQGNLAYGYYGYIDGEQNRVEGLLSNDYALSDGGYYIVVPAGSPAPRVTNNGGLNNTRFAETLESVLIEGALFDCYRLLVSSKDVGGTRSFDQFKKQNYTLEVACDIPSGSMTAKVSGTFIVNFTFACAVERDANAAAKWGKEGGDPWIVRLGRQFIGCLGSNGPNDGVGSVQDCYANSMRFSQTHNIDLADAPVNGVSKFRRTFNRSTYEGNGNAIYGLQYRLQNGEIDGEHNGVSGLFCNVYASKISNVRLVIDASADGSPYRVSSPNYNMRFGLLAGSMEESTVANCTVEARGKDSAHFTVMKTSGGGNYLYLGALIGYGKLLTLANCSVSGVQLDVVSEDGKEWGAEPCIGLLMGYSATSTNMDYCSASNTVIGLSVPAQKSKYVNFGGIVGYVDSYLGASNCSFKDSSLNMPAGQDPARVRAGICAGRVTWHAGVAHNTATNMNVVVEGLAPLPVTKDVGA